MIEKVMSARVNYDMQLKELKNQMLLLGSMVEDVIRETISALVNKDVEKAREIAESDDKIDAQVRNIEQSCYTLLLRQQPIARDLRMVSAALRMISDLERIGDQGADISELTVLMNSMKYPKEIKLIEEMAKETSVMLIEAVVGILIVGVGSGPVFGLVQGVTVIENVSERICFCRSFFLQKCKIL